MTKELEGEAEPEPPQDPNLGYEPPPAPDPADVPPPQPAPEFEPIQVSAPGPRAPFDIDLGPDHTQVKEGGSEPIEPVILGPGGTFGMDPLRNAAPRAIVKPVVPSSASRGPRRNPATLRWPRRISPRPPPRRPVCRA